MGTYRWCRVNQPWVKLNYLNRQWPTLTVYTEHGDLRIDNNLVENAIRPFVVGRKNYSFCDSVAGANATANLYSLIETAKANAIAPYRYLRHVFTELPKATSIEDIEALLPHCLGETLRLRCSGNHAGVERANWRNTA